MKTIDLHVHSNASDGTFSPKDLVKLAYKTKLSAFALTDHDTIDGISEALEEASNYDIEVIPSIELAADYNGKEIHILGLNIDYKNLEFNNIIQNLKFNREQRNKEMIKKLSELGFDINIDELHTLAKGQGTITRAHFAAVLLSKGYVKSREEAFEKYLGQNAYAYVKRDLPNSQFCIDSILKANGIPILAHPTLYKMTDEEIENMVKTLVCCNLKGIEGIYPLYSAKQTEYIKNLAAKYSLKISGGSDFHGLNKPNIALGTGINNNISVPYSILNNLLNK